MTKSEVIQRIRDVGVIPVVRASSAEEAVQVVEAIKAGGVSILEITMTVPGAVQVIEQLVRRFDDETVVGAGTVLDPEVANACISVGAQFIVSPALNLETIKFCRDQDIPVMPGALTPTEVVTAWNAGADFVKVFPCGAVGGAGYIKSLKAPLPQIELVPTGGVSLKTATGETLTASAVDSVNTFAAPKTVAPKPVTAKVQGDQVFLTLEPKSVTVLAVRN